MEKVRIIVDTSSDISAEEAEKRDIVLLPVGIHHRDRSYREAYDIVKRDFWKLLRESETIPTTSQISPEQLTSAYNDVWADGCTHAIVVTVNSAGSGMYQNAHLSKNLFQEAHGKDAMDITIIDSHTYSYLYGRQVLRAAEMLESGASAEKVISFFKYRLSRVYAYAPIYTLKYAKKSGRIGGASAFAGEILGYKPIMYIGGGRVDTTEKVRGEALILPRTIELVKQHAVDLEHQEVMILFGDLDDAERAKVFDAVRRELCPASIFVGDIGCSVTNNAGPRIFAVVFYGPDNGLYD